MFGRRDPADAALLWGRLVLLLALVSAVGLVSGLLAVRGSLQRRC